MSEQLDSILSNLEAIYIAGRKSMQDEIIDYLGNYDANKCAQIAASIDATKLPEHLKNLNR
jgi:hypothetical protein